jgi:hypothetical protein
MVEHGPHALPKAWLLIGWLACRLGWRPQAGKVAPGVEVTWGFQSDRGPIEVTVRRRSDGEPEVYRTSLRWGSGGARNTETFALVGGGRIAVIREESGESIRVVAAPAQQRAALVARQLSDLGRDALFRRTLEISRTMAMALPR